jgi:aminoglycoside phosphotransferase (APT) family kinase protein
MMYIPNRSDAIDPVWLTSALSARDPDVHVAAVEVVERAELTNHHCLLRIDYHESATCPMTMFCKLLPSDSSAREAIAATGMGSREAQFYASLAQDVSVRVPTPYVARHDPNSGAFVLLLEDLMATGAGISDGTTTVVPDAAAVALEDLAALHIRFSSSERRASEAPWLSPPLHQPSYGSTMLQLALDQHRERLSADFAAMADLYIRAADALHALWLEGPKTLIHGDPHIGNLFDPDPEPGERTGFLDWGIISSGTPLRDVSYFLCQALSTEDRRANEAELLRHYLEIWNSGSGFPIGFEDAWRSHRIHAAYGVLACCQIVTFPEGQSEARRVFSEAFLARSEAALADLDSLSVLAELGIR